MGRAEARSAGIRRPDGVARSFHVSLYKVEPTKSVFARNLLAKDDCRSALLNKPMEGGPKVPLVSKPSAFACRAERLARAGTGPDGPVVGPAGAAQGVGPDGDAGKEVALGVSGQIGGCDIFDAPFVYVAGRDMALRNQLAQPCGRLGVNLVIISSQCRPPSCAAPSSKPSL